MQYFTATSFKPGYINRFKTAKTKRYFKADFVKNLEFTNSQENSKNYTN